MAAAAERRVLTPAATAAMAAPATAVREAGDTVLCSDGAGDGGCSSGGDGDGVGGGSGDDAPVPVLHTP